MGESRVGIGHQRGDRERERDICFGLKRDSYLREREREREEEEEEEEEADRRVSRGNN